MKQIESSLLRHIAGGYGIGGGITPPENPPREANAANTDGSYTPPPPETEEGN
jgi:hypothetical protein